MIRVVVDENTRVVYKGRHRDIAFEVSGFRFKEPTSPYEQPVMWATYILLSEKMHEKFKERINDAPWNGGQTYYRRHTEEHVDAPPELKAKWDGSYYKIGDDFSHLWDIEHGRYHLYNRDHIEHHIRRVIDFLHDGSTK